MKRLSSRGTRRPAARPKRAISTVFALIQDLLDERRKELIEHTSRLRIADTQTALLEDIAIERHGRLLELTELANRISVLGFERFGQRLDLLPDGVTVGRSALKPKGAP